MRSTRSRQFVVLVFASASATPAAAEVVSASPNGFEVRESVQLVVPPDQAWDAFEQVGSWWNPGAHLLGKAANMRMALSLGACLCETFDQTGGGIEHLRVVYAEPNKRAILTGSLGPLLYEATSGVMDLHGRADRRGVARDDELSRQRLLQGRRRQARAGGRPGPRRPNEALPRLRDRAAAQPLGALEGHEAERRALRRMLLAPHLAPVRRSRDRRGPCRRRRPRALRSARCAAPAAGTAGRSPPRRSPRSACPPASRSALFDIARDLGALGAPAGVARQDDMPPAGKQPGQAFERLSPHDHRAAHGQRLEPLEVGGDVPGHGPAAADHAVLRACDDEGDGRPGHATALAGVRGPAKRAIAPA